MIQSLIVFSTKCF